MRCLICNIFFSDDVIKNHYQYYHSIKENNYFFEQLFLQDDNSKRWDECKMKFKNCRQKRNHHFLYHYRRTGWEINQQLLVNIIRGGPITYYSINYQQHKNLYDFFDEAIVETFFNSVRNVFVTYGRDEFKMQGYAKIKNYQQTEIVELENIRVWLTNVFISRYFNDFARGSMKEDILKRVIINGSTGRSWLFKQFNKLQVIVTTKTVFKSIMSW